MAPFHANEAKNLLDKLDDAAANARKHSKGAPQNAARAVLVRLPETIAIEACREWALEYVKENSDGPVDAVLLYQPAVADLGGDQTAIVHAFAHCPAASYSEWLRPDRRLNLSVLVGICTGASHRKLLGKDAPDVAHMYNYQRGEYFTVHHWKPNVPLTGTVSSLASGIFQNVIIRNESGEMVLNGIFPPEKSLSLFD